MKLRWAWALAKATEVFFVVFWRESSLSVTPSVVLFSVVSVSILSGGVFSLTSS